MTTLATATGDDVNFLEAFAGNIISIPRRNALSYHSLPYRSLRGLHSGELTQRNTMGLGGHLTDPANLFAVHERQNIRILALVFSTLSFAATLITIYWFFMMQRNFRRHLILLLILGDSFKSLWYLLFAGAALGGANVATETVFCQANGFLLQGATEACDGAILFMSVHMSIQIFSPNSKIFGHDGLYRFRHTVIALYFLLPTLSAALAFINSNHGYILQGAFCTLPIRPYWYRLALTWIPRYLVWAYVVYVALRIYIKVGRGFKVFARQAGGISSCEMMTASDNVPAPQKLNVIKKRPPPISLGLADRFDGVPPLLSAATTAVASPMETDRLTGGFNWPSTPTSVDVSDGSEPAAGGKSRRGSRVAFEADSVLNVDHAHNPSDQKLPVGSVSTLSSYKSTGDMSAEENRPSTLERIEEGLNDNQLAGVDLESADTPLQKRRRDIQRQLRLLFIYPAVYMIMWTIPFAYHSMNYSNYYAQHPVYVLGALAAACQCGLGCVDCTVFGWREKPWRHIPGSDGTFLGSFMFWRFHQGPSTLRGSVQLSDEPVAQESSKPIRARLSLRSSSYNSMNPMVHKKTFSGSSDRSAMEAERASERLALERAERGRSLPHTRNSSMNANPRPPMEWWDRGLSHTVSETPTIEVDEPGLH